MRKNTVTKNSFKILFALTAAFFSTHLLDAQEINASVQVVAPRVQQSDKNILQTLQNSIQQFINNRKWTEDKVEMVERIDVSLFMEITDFENNNFTGTVQLQVIRPVYNSTYKTTVLQFNDDDVSFSYREFENLDYQENMNMNDLTTLLAYYVYIALGVDHDSFGELGGSEHLTKAQSIVNLMSNKPGWNQGDGKGFRNRFYLAENLTSPRFKEFRELSYKYHRLGLDQFHENPEKGRKVITETLQKIQEASQNNRNSLMQKLFFTTKWPELVEIYKGGTAAEKANVTKLLMDIDPTNSKRYENIKA
jgi:hypothetical protein